VNVIRKKVRMVKKQFIDFMGVGRSDQVMKFRGRKLKRRRRGAVVRES
jgi:hypothetical protein